MKIPKIVFEDNFILVINKPSGLVVNRAETVKVETLQDWVDKTLSNCQIVKLSNSDSRWRSGIVHRLDKETSGLLVIAKDIFSFQNLQKQFKERKVKKQYLALVHGWVKPKIGDIKLPLARNPSDRKKFTVRLGGKKAITEYKVLKYVGSSEKKFSLLKINLKTGRTHQIRVHLKYIGYPLAADSIYLGSKRLKNDNKWCPRLFLQAEYLSFFHPQTNQRREFQIPLCLDLKKALRAISNEKNKKIKARKK